MAPQSMVEQAVVDNQARKKGKDADFLHSFFVKKVITGLVKEFPYRSEKEIIRAVLFCRDSFKFDRNWIRFKECAKQLLKDEWEGASAQEWAP